MNQVDIYIGHNRLDLFDDEEISINLSVQNYKELDKIFTDFTQSFTIPATGRNNEILAHYYRTDVDSLLITDKGFINAESLFEAYEARVLNNGGEVEGRDCCISALDALGGSYYETSEAGSFDGRLRPTARIEINSLLFRDGVIQIEQVLMKGTEPYAYTFTFYGYLVNLTDLFGEDYLYDLDLSAYDHDYNGATIQSGFDSNSLFSGEVIYPMMSPVRNWVYDVLATDPNHDNDIHYDAAHGHGINYYELKPAIKVVKLLEAIEAKYGVTFSGSFLSDTQFNKLYLWAHRFEGYLYDNASAIEWQVINFDNNSGGGTQFDLATDIWTVAETHEHQLRVTVYAPSASYELGLFVNGVESGIAREDASAGFVTSTFDGYIFTAGDQVQLKIRPQLPVTMTYQVTAFGGWTSDDGIPDTLQFGVDQTSTATYSFQLAMSPLMPEIKVADFLSGIVKMHNLVVVPTSESSFSFYTLDDWYAAGNEIDLQTFIDINEVEVKRPDLFRRIQYKYQETDQILGFQYRKTNTVGYGDLNSDFQFDGDEFQVELPFECPLFEKLTNYQGHGTGTAIPSNVLVYKSITNEADDTGAFNPYVGAPVLIYADWSLDISSNPVGFIDESLTNTQVNTVWYVNTSSSVSGTGLAYSLTWGSDIDPYYLEPIGKSLFQTYWSDYIIDLYAKQKRVYQVNAVLPLGKILNLDLNNLIVWNNQKFRINNVNLNLASGKARFELLNEV